MGASQQELTKPDSAGKVSGSATSPHSATQGAVIGTPFPASTQLEATQTVYGSAEPAMPAILAPAALGQTFDGPMNMAHELYSPPGAGPVYLGATVGHGPVPLHCGQCGYRGPSTIRQTRGWAHGLWAMMTFGIGLLVPVAMDSNHFCPQCGRNVAVAKLM
jgi:ribosomal protein S27AE